MDRITQNYSHATFEDKKLPPRSRRSLRVDILYITLASELLEPAAASIEDTFLRKSLLSCWLLLAAGPSSSAFRAVAVCGNKAAQPGALKSWMPAPACCNLVAKPSADQGDRNEKQNEKHPSLQEQMGWFQIKDLYFIPLPFFPSTGVHIFPRLVPDQPGFFAPLERMAVETRTSSLSFHSMVGPSKG